MHMAMYSSCIITSKLLSSNHAKVIFYLQLMALTVTREIYIAPTTSIHATKELLQSNPVMSIPAAKQP